VASPDSEIDPDPTAVAGVNLSVALPESVITRV
jgi:hypothetical protein